MINLAQNLEHWMSVLPQKLKSIPINQLAIPGSHDSTTYGLSGSSQIAPDAKPTIQYLKFLQPVLGPFICKWSKTQAADVRAQLANGVRYFDLRIATREGDPAFYFVHNLYAEPVNDAFTAVRTFLNDHPREVVILDCQHFYKMALKDHHRFIELLDSAFRGKLLPFNSDMKHLTLNYITETCNSQVILIYRSSNVFKWFLWPSHSFPTPWPNTVSIPYLISFITRGLEQRDLSWGFVTQCVLTPTLWFACRFLFSSLKSRCVLPLEQEKYNWLKRQSPGVGGINIVISDFVEYKNYQFCKEVINLNLKLLERPS